MNSGNLFELVIFFVIGVVITRWVFGIEKIIESLKLQNERSLIQIRLLKKMLLRDGIPTEEVDDIIKNGNS